MGAKTNDPPLGEMSLEMGPEDAPFPCDDCGGATYVLRGGVRADGRDRAVYVAAQTEGHRPIALALSVGRFGQGTSPADRVVFTLLARVEEGSIELMVVDPDRCPFDCAEVLGACGIGRFATARGDRGRTSVGSSPPRSPWRRGAMA